MYEDGRFARHPRSLYFALNTEMGWRALQTGCIYVCQYQHDVHLSGEEIRDMVGRPEAFSNRVLHYAASLRGTRHYWFRQRSRLIIMVDTLGLSTIFFTHSAADLQWPELAKLISRVLPVMSEYRLPHGHYGYSGHVINLPQDVASFASPHYPISPAS